MPKFDKIEKQRLIDTYKACGGKITAVCKALRISRDCFYDNLNKNPEVRLLVDFAENEMIDTLEQTAFALATGKPKTKLVDGKQVFDGWEIRPNQDVTMFMLESKGKSRGYGKEQKIDMKVEGEMKVKGEVSFNLNPLNLDSDE